MQAEGVKNKKSLEKRGFEKVMKRLAKHQFENERNVL